MLFGGGCWKLFVFSSYAMFLEPKQQFCLAMSFITNATESVYGLNKTWNENLVLNVIDVIRVVQSCFLRLSVYLKVGGCGLALCDTIQPTRTDDFPTVG